MRKILGEEKKKTIPHIKTEYTKEVGRMVYKIFHTLQNSSHPNSNK